MLYTYVLDAFKSLARSGREAQGLVLPGFGERWIARCIWHTMVVRNILKNAGAKRSGYNTVQFVCDTQDTTFLIHVASQMAALMIPLMPKTAPGYAAEATAITAQRLQSYFPSSILSWESQMLQAYVKTMNVVPLEDKTPRVSPKYELISGQQVLEFALEKTPLSVGLGMPVHMVTQSCRSGANSIFRLFASAEPTLCGINAGVIAAAAFSLCFPLTTVQTWREDVRRAADQVLAKPTLDGYIFLVHIDTQEPLERENRQRNGSHAFAFLVTTSAPGVLAFKMFCAYNCSVGSDQAGNMVGHHDGFTVFQWLRLLPCETAITSPYAGSQLM
ncbi:MAG TPA: hypothetical protein V6D20_01220, partial [Candidatus Obscuribacterales bacterium]